MPARTKLATKASAKKTTRKKAAVRQKVPSPRLPVLDENELTAEQRSLLDSIRTGPRGPSIEIRGPFAVFLHAPVFGQFAQALGGHVRYKTGVSARLSSSPFSAPRGSGARSTSGSRTSRRPSAPASSRPRSAICTPAACPKSAPKDERAIYEFIHELYKTRRVSDKTYKKVQAALGDAATVELVGILGYYVMIAMILNVYRMMPPEDLALPFAEK